MLPTLKQRLTKIFFHWLPLGVAIIGLASLSYLGLQQSFRSHLNDPQLQLATDGARFAETNKNFGDFTSNINLTDISKDLGPFIGLYDKNGTAISSTGRLNDAAPKIPEGVFEAATKYGRDIVSWQPNATTRVALVVVPVINDQHQFVISGRNMREEESRIQSLTIIFGIGLICILIGTFLVELISDEVRRRLKEKSQ